MPRFDESTADLPVKALYLGHTGCLTEDTLVSARRGSYPKYMRLDVLYDRVKGKHGRSRGESQETFLVADLGGYAGQAKLLDIFPSGKKEIYEITSGRKTIRASADHQFKTIEGWAKLSDLEKGIPLAAWRSARNKIIRNREIDNTYRKGRVWVYSIPYHPFAVANWVAGRNYKRLVRARLIIEAAMNGISLEEFISILRREPDIAATLQYTSPEDDIHHLDGVPTNDAIENLQIVDRLQHIREHHEEKIRESKSLDWTRIESIERVGEEKTFDLVMEAPWHNFIANGFVVHNSGKTGSLCSLAAAGYNVRVLDLDSGVEVIRDYLLNPASPYRKADPTGLWTQAQADSVLERMSYLTVSEEFLIQGPRAIPKASAWTKVAQKLNSWIDGQDKFGGVSTWSSRDVLVIDGLSRLCEAAMNFQLLLNNRLDKGPQVGTSGDNDYTGAYRYIRELLDLLKCSEIRCNVIMICHIQFLEEPSASPAQRGGRRDMRGFPQTIGPMLSPRIGQYFNTTLRAKSVGNHPSIRRVIVTNNDESIELKNTAPLRVKQEYPLSTGLAEYFQAIRGPLKPTST